MIDTESPFSFELPNGDVRTALVVARYENKSEIVVFLAPSDPQMYGLSGEPSSMPHLMVDNKLTPTEFPAQQSDVTALEGRIKSLEAAVAKAAAQSTPTVAAAQSTPTVAAAKDSK